jgi:SAM-dependent methyltransferase
VTESSSRGAATLSSAMSSARRYNAWALEGFAGCFGTSVVEVGCGYGNLRELLPPGVRYAGIDADPALVARASALNPGVTFQTVDVQDPAFVGVVAPLRPDAVLCVNVLEHLDRPDAALAHMAGVLPPDGRLLLFVPALPILYNELDRLAGHRRRFVRRELEALVAPHFTVASIRYFNPLGAIGWWMNGVMPHRSLEGQAVTAQVAFFDKVVLPVSRALDAATRAWFGQSLVVVGVKT